MSTKTIVLAAGGSGGHVFPALALGEQLVKRGYKVVVFTDKRGMGYQWDKKFDLILIPSAQLTGPPWALLKGFVLHLAGFLRARRKLKMVGPEAVIGFGGYPSLPTMLAAASRKLPTLVHQADAILGRVNQLLAPYVTRIATSFPNTAGLKEADKSKVTFTGLPVRQAIQYAPYDEVKGSVNILVTGGSQGAKVFSDILPSAIKAMPQESQERLVIAQQCRPESLDDTKAHYGGCHAKIELKPFFDDMGVRLKKAHLVICRAGASSVVEVATVGRPGIFIPYPFATLNHQAYNAQEAVAVGGGWCFEQKDLNSATLTNLLNQFMKSPWQFTEAAARMRQIVVPDAAGKLADAVEDMVKSEKEGKKAA